MNKILRFTMLSLLAFVSAISFAQTEIDFTKQTITATDDGFTLTASGYTFAAAKESGSTAPTQNGKSKDLRIYAKNTLKVSGTGFTKLVFTMSKQGLKRWADVTPTVGQVTLDTDAGTTTWTNTTAVTEVTFTVGDKATHGTDGDTKAGQFDLDKVVVTSDGGSTDPTTLAAPTISGETPFAESTTVTITAAEGATVYYTTNGQDPDDREGTEYTEPFTLTESATVKAIAYKGELESTIASKEFKKAAAVAHKGTEADPYTASDALSIIAAGSETKDSVFVSGTIASIDNIDTGSYGNATFNISEDGTETNAITAFRVKYLENNKFTSKDQIKVSDKVVIKTVLVNYKGTPELNYGYIYSLNGKTSDDSKVTPKDTASYTVAQAVAVLTAGTETTDVVYVTGKVSKVDEVSAQYGNATYYISDDGTENGQLQVYRGKYLNNEKFTSEDQLKVGDEVKVAGVLTNYTKGETTTQEITNSWIVSINGGETPVTPVVTAANIAEFVALAKGTNATLTLKDAQVVYTWTSNGGNTSTYVRDATGALDFFNTGLDLKANDVLNGTVKLTRDDYNNLVEAIKNDETNADNLTITAGQPAEPKVITTAEAASNISDLVQFSGVNIVEDGGKFYIGTGDSRVQVYNGFHLDGYTVAAAENVNVKGILVQYKSTVEVYPIEVPKAATGINDIKADTVLDVNAPLYNLAGQRVNKSFKGVVIQNGRKFILK